MAKASKIKDSIISFKPLNSCVLILPTKAPDRVGSILLPDTAKKTANNGKVIALAHDVESVSEGDLVWYGSYAGTGITIDGTDYLVIKEEDLLAVEENK